MKKKLKLLLMSSVVFSIVQANEFGKCSTKEDALNMMIASQVYSNKLTQDYLNTIKLLTAAKNAYDQKKIKNSDEFKNIEDLSKKANELSKLTVQYSKDSSFYSRLITNEKYQETCDKFIVLAKKYNYDIEELSKTTIKVDKRKNESSCKREEAQAVLMVLLKKPSVKNNIDTSSKITAIGIDILKNPDLACKKIKELALKSGESYDELLKRAKIKVETSKFISQESEKIEEKNAKNNSVCTRVMAKDLLFQKRDFRKSIYDISDLWHQLGRTASHAPVRDKKLIKFLFNKKDEIHEVADQFDDEFTDTVEKSISDGHYDKACATYKQLTAKYSKKLSKEKEEYQTFIDNKLNKVTGSIPAAASESTKKYQAVTKAFNLLMPKIKSSFASYVKGCGKDAKNRRKQMYTDMGDGEKVKIPNYYGYMHAFYKVHYKDAALKNIDLALSIDALPKLNEPLKAYRKSILEFTEIFDEASQYYLNKDYKDDNYKKADELHPKVIQAHDNLMQEYEKLADIIKNIGSAKTQQKIEQYKNNNQMIFYHVEKAKKHAREFMRYAKSKDDQMALDSDEVKKYYDAMKEHLDEVEKFKKENKQLFIDNTNYRYYFEQYASYIEKSKVFYKKVQSKTLYEDESEKEMIEHLPKNARDMMLANMEGSTAQLISSYNSFVRQYRRLNLN